MRIFVSVFFLLFICRSVCSQSVIDSLEAAYKSASHDTLKIDILLELAFRHNHTDNQEALTKALEAYELSKNSGENKRIHRSYFVLGRVYMHRGQFLEALESYQKALEYAVKPQEIISSKWGIAVTYNGMGNFDAAMGNFVLALKYSEEHSPENYPRMVSDVGIILAQNGDFNNALKYEKEALALYRKANRTYNVARVLANIGSIYMEMNVLDSARHYYNQAFTIEEKSGNPDDNADLMYNMGILYLKTKDIPKAKSFLFKSLNTSRRLGLFNYEADVLNGLGELYLTTSRHDSVRYYVNQSLNLSKKMDLLQTRLRSYELLYRSGEETKNYHNAFFYLSKYIALHDSIFNETKNKQITELKTKYETEKKEQQIKLLQQEATLANLKNNIFVSGIAGVVVLASLIFYSYRQKIKRSKAEKSKLEDELVFKKKELTTHALHLVQKNELLNSLQEKLQELKKDKENDPAALQRIIQTIDQDKQIDKDWENFKTYFEQVHENFDKKLVTHFGQITNNEMRLIVLTKMDLTTKEIATVLNISPESVNKARYRLRKKLNLPEDESFRNFIMAL